MSYQIEIKNIKNIISPRCFGKKTTKGIRPSATKKSLEKNFKKPITNKLIEKHTKNEDTLFFYGNEDYKKNETLLMIDIDVQKKNKIGTTEEAIRFAEYINQYINFYYEPSTNGLGLHGYLIIDKENKPASALNIIFKEFENYLVSESKKICANIETVEIKGTLHEIEYENSKIKKIKYGMLGKLPRDIESFFKKSKTIKISEIEKNYCIEYKNKNKNKHNKKGSISRKFINKNYLRKIKYLKNISKEILGNQIIKIQNHKIKNKDMCIFLMLLMFFKKNKNKDDTLPIKRIEKLWKSLYDCGDIDRGWNHRKIAYMRNILSKKGLIKWKDNKYHYGDKLLNKKGIACKWEITSSFYNYCTFQCKKLKKEKKKRSSLMDTSSLENIKIYNIEEIKYKHKYKKPILSLFFIDNFNKIQNKAIDIIKNMYSYDIKYKNTV